MKTNLSYISINKKTILSLYQNKNITNLSDMVDAALYDGTYDLF